MPDVIEATETEVTVPVNGKDQVFKILNTYDKANLLKAAQKRQRQQIIDDCKDAGLDQAQTFSQLQDFRENNPPADEDTWVKFVRDPENSQYIYIASLIKNGVAADAAEALSRAVEMSIADKAKLCGLTVSRQFQPAAGDEENPTETPATHPGQSA